MIKEACVETYNEALLAEERGANRIELCSRLDLDGLTPSTDLMVKTCAALKIPVMVMIRPRAGSFVYNTQEVNSMMAEIDIARKSGAAGIVLGLLTTGNKIDVVNTRKLVEHAHPLPVTFHKAIDELNDLVEGVKLLRQIKGIRRILTSGGKPTALEGKETIKEMIKNAGDDLVILVAGKVTAENIDEVKQATKATEFHGRRIVGELIRRD